MRNRPREALLLCEGYDDRSFWKGWIGERLGWPEKRGREEGRHSAAGVFTYGTPGGGRVHVVPCHGRSRELPATHHFRDEVRAFAGYKLSERAAKPFARLVLNVDVDDGTVSALRASVRSLVSAHDARETEDGDFVLDDGGVVSLIPWHVVEAGAADPSGVPAKQTLERIVCTAICRVKPAWGADVSAWLTGRHEPRGPEHKAHAWSFAAGWFADHGPGDFYATLWRDPDIAGALEKQMDDIGARRVLDELARLGTAED